MGAGASSGLGAAVKASSDADLKAALASLSEEGRKKLQDALTQEALKKGDLCLVTCPPDWKDPTVYLAVFEAEGKAVFFDDATGEVNGVASIAPVTPEAMEANIKKYQAALAEFTKVAGDEKHTETTITKAFDHVKAAMGGTLGADDKIGYSNDAEGKEGALLINTLAGAHQQRQRHARQHPRVCDAMCPTPTPMRPPRRPGSQLRLDGGRVAHDPLDVRPVAGGVQGGGHRQERHHLGEGGGRRVAEARREHDRGVQRAAQEAGQVRSAKSRHTLRPQPGSTPSSRLPVEDSGA